MTPEQLQALRSMYDKLAVAFELLIERRDGDDGDFNYIVYGPDGDFCWVPEDPVKRAKEKAQLIVELCNSAPALFSAIERLQDELGEAHAKVELHYNAYLGAEARRKAAYIVSEAAVEHRERVGISGSTIDDVEGLLMHLGEAPTKYDDKTTAVQVIQRIVDQRDAAEGNAVHLEQKLEIARDLEDELRTELAEQKRNVLVERAEAHASRAEGTAAILAHGDTIASLEAERVKTAELTAERDKARQHLEQSDRDWYAKLTACDAALAAARADIAKLEKEIALRDGAFT